MKKRIIIVIVGCLFWTLGILAKTSAGILPYAYKRGTVYFLIGKEPNGVWADFGGNAEPQDQTTKDTAAREFSEETRYVYGKYHLGLPLRKRCDRRCKKASSAYIKPRITGIVHHPKGYYDMFLAKVDYIPVGDFKKAYRVPDYEKRDYAWVPADRFMRAIKQSRDRLNTYVGARHIRKEFVDMIQSHYQTIRRIIE